MDEYTDLHFAASIGDIASVKSLLQQDCDLNAFDDVGFTPLHHAARAAQMEVIEVLLQAGADVNAHDESQIGNTPLGEIAGYCSYEIAKILVDNGADPMIKGWMQLSALDRAQDRKREEGKRVYDLLLKAKKP
ncbi:hypothetical protein BH11VER1_BH11VER1_01600 [soil metagenome]